jgi:RNA polymerase sigma factor (sigma-70 family)
MKARNLERLFVSFRDRGDGAALAAVFDHTSEELLQVACHLLRDPSLAEDVVQATFLTAIRQAERYDGSSPVQGWLYGILWREAAKVRRDSARQADPSQLVARSAEDPADSLAAAEVPEEVVRALRRLPDPYREVVEPHLCEGRSPGEIARQLGRSPGTVRSQIHRGLERLRRSLPAGLAPAQGMIALKLRGLEAVRESVLASAGASSNAAATSAGGGGLASALSGALVLKGLAVAASVGAVALAGRWFFAAGTFDGSPLADASVLAAPRGDTSPAAAPTAQPANDSEPPSSVARASIEPAPASIQGPDTSVEYWLARFRAVGDDWSSGWAVAAEVAKLPPADALRIMTGVWPHLPVPVKEQVLKPFVFDGGHPEALAMLHLAATDGALSVQERAFSYLKDYAFQDFSTDYEGYLRWYAANEGRPLADVLTESAQRFVRDLLALSPTELAVRVHAVRRLDLHAGTNAGVDLAEVMRQAGGLRLLEACLLDADPELRSTALSWSSEMGAGEAWLRTWVLPSIEGGSDVDPQVLDASFRALGRPECAWAREPLVAYLRRCTGDDPGQASGAASALADIGDARAIPQLIEILLADREGKLRYEVGYFGLARLTGVTWHESYDGAWWLDWWDKNHRRLPPEVQSMTIEH